MRETSCEDQLLSEMENMRHDAPPSIGVKQRGDVIILALPNHFLRRPPLESLFELAIIGLVLAWATKYVLAVMANPPDDHQVVRLVMWTGTAVISLGLVAAVFLIVGLIVRDELEIQPEEVRYRRRRRVLSDVAARFMADSWNASLESGLLEMCSKRFPLKEHPTLGFRVSRPRGSYTYIIRSTVRGLAHDADSPRGPVTIEVEPSSGPSLSEGQTGMMKIEIGPALDGEERCWLMEFLRSWQSGGESKSA